MNSSKFSKLLCLAFTLIFALLLLSCGSDEADISIVTSAQDGYRSEYTVIYGDGFRESAEELSQMIFEKYGIKTECLSDTQSSTSEFEILIGASQRPDHSRLRERIDNEYPRELYYSWGYSVSENRLLLYFSHDTYSREKLFELISPLMRKSGFSLSRDAELIKSRSIYLEDTEQSLGDKLLSMGELKERFYKALNKNNSLLYENGKDHLAAFGGSLTKSLSEASGISYPIPDAHPKFGEHPKVNVNKDLLIDLKSAFNSGDIAIIKHELLELADSELDGCFDASETLYTDREMARILSVIEAKALTYLITERTAYGYEALVGIKEALLNITVKNVSTASYLITVLSEVYDWCYDILNEKDREQLIAGAQECIISLGDIGIGFPPKGASESALNSDDQKMIQAYLALSAAIYDEYPDWWNFCLGRFYSELCEPVNAYLKSGTAPGGSAGCAGENLYIYLKTARLLDALACGIPFEGLGDAYKSLLAHTLPNGDILATGELPLRGEPCADTYYKICIMSASLFNDAEAHYYGRLYSDNYEKFEYSTLRSAWTPTDALLYISSIKTDAEAPPEMPLVKYNGSPAGQMIVRGSLDAGAAVVLMRVGSTACTEHKHLDSGTFQIYYKGLISGVGRIDSEDCDRCQKYYNEATISKNGLLIFDPELYSEAEFDKDGNIIDPDSAFYTGGQAAAHEGGDLEHTYFYKYSDDNNTVKYAYIAAELTSAYDESSVEFFERRMLTLYTDDPSFPMLFIVFDRAISKNPNAQKKFLLQASSEPTVTDTDADGSPDSVIIKEAGGALVLTPLLGFDSIEAVSSSHSSLGINADTPAHSQADIHSPIGHRAEITASGECVTEMLNLMYVKDAEDSAYLSPKLIEAEALIGVQIGSEIAVFVNDSSQNTQMIEFVARKYEGTDLGSSDNISCFVSGVKSGTYTVLVDGVKYGTAICPSGKDSLTLTVPDGRITLVRSDIDN